VRSNGGGEGSGGGSLSPATYRATSLSVARRSPALVSRTSEREASFSAPPNGNRSWPGTDVRESASGPRNSVNYLPLPHVVELPRVGTRRRFSIGRTGAPSWSMSNWMCATSDIVSRQRKSLSAVAPRTFCTSTLDVLPKSSGRPEDSGRTHVSLKVRLRGRSRWQLRSSCEAHTACSPDRGAFEISPVHSRTEGEASTAPNCTSAGWEST